MWLTDCIIINIKLITWWENNKGQLSIMVNSLCLKIHNWLSETPSLSHTIKAIIEKWALMFLTVFNVSSSKLREVFSWKGITFRDRQNQWKKESSHKHMTTKKSQKDSSKTTQNPRDKYRDWRHKLLNWKTKYKLSSQMLSLKTNLTSYFRKWQSIEKFSDKPCIKNRICLHQLPTFTLLHLILITPPVEITIHNISPRELTILSFQIDIVDCWESTSLLLLFLYFWKARRESWVKGERVIWELSIFKSSILRCCSSKIG